MGRRMSREEELNVWKWCESHMGLACMRYRRPSRTVNSLYISHMNVFFQKVYAHIVNLKKYIPSIKKLFAKSWWCQNRSNYFWEIQVFNFLLCEPPLVLGVGENLRDICRRTLDMEFQRNRSIGLGSTFDRGHTDRYTVFASRDGGWTV